MKRTLTILTLLVLTSMSYGAALIKRDELLSTYIINCQCCVWHDKEYHISIAGNTIIMWSVDSEKAHDFCQIGRVFCKNNSCLDLELWPIDYSAERPFCFTVVFKNGDPTNGVDAKSGNIVMFLKRPPVASGRYVR